MKRDKEKGPIFTDWALSFLAPQRGLPSFHSGQAHLDPLIKSSFFSRRHPLISRSRLAASYLFSQISEYKSLALCCFIL